ncbi:MAG: hypothetical protein ACK5P7_00445 [Bdellovibrio sp.]|jgi:hypothetical protein
MTSSLMLTFLITFGFWFGARADILFLDLNDAKQEIEAAEKAARSRGEKLIVIPGANSRAQVTPDQIKAEVLRMKAAGVRLSSVVISGHDGNGRFSGTRGTTAVDMTADALKDALAVAPEVVQDVRSVLLWGCRTTNIGSVDVHWKPIFPNVGVFAGFDGRGPSKIRDANHRYLEDFLRIDRDLIAAKDKASMEQLVNGIGGFNITASSICTDKFMVTPTGPGARANARDIGAIRRDCNPRLPEIKKGLEIFNCYRNARGTVKVGNRTLNCSNPPSTTVSGDPQCVAAAATAYDSETCNPLGVFHQVLSNKMQCRAYWEEIRSDIEVPEPHLIQMLMHFDNFKSNLGNLHRAELAKMDALLAEVGAPAGLRVGNIPQMSRAEIIKRLGDLTSFLGNPNVPDIDNPKAVQLDQLRESSVELSQIISSLEKAPPEWYNANDNTVAPSLRSVLTPARANEIRVDHQMIRIDRTVEAQKRELQSSHRLAGEIRNVEQQFDRADLSARMSLISKRTDLIRQRDQDIAAQIKTQVQAQMQRRAQQGYSSPYEEQAYKRYIENLDRRRR